MQLIWALVILESALTPQIHYLLNWFGAFTDFDLVPNTCLVEISCPKYMFHYRNVYHVPLRFFWPRIGKNNRYGTTWWYQWYDIIDIISLSAVCCWNLKFNFVIHVGLCAWGPSVAKRSKNTEHASKQMRWKWSGQKPVLTKWERHVWLEGPPYPGNPW